MTDKELDARWQLSLDGLKEVSGQYVTLTRIVQNGFGTIGERLDNNSRRIGTLESEAKATRATISECQRELAALKAERQAGAATMRLLMAFVVALLIATIGQTALWWYLALR